MGCAIFVEPAIAEKLKSSTAASVSRTINTWSFLYKKSRPTQFLKVTWAQQVARIKPKPSKPIELLLYGSLRYLGRGWTFDDLEENTEIGQETFRRFFHKFIQFGITLLLYDEFVMTPSESDQDTATHQCMNLLKLNIMGQLDLQMLCMM